MDTNTITATVIDHEPVEFLFDGVTIPVATGFNADGTIQTAATLARTERIDPLDCSHYGATWSSNLALRCPTCGSSMFLPPRLLSYLPAGVISAMDLLWSTAGWPAWCGMSWSILPEHWTIMPHPLFDHCGGLPVRHDRAEKYYDALVALAEDDHE
jgi:hypothetical protein